MIHITASYFAKLTYTPPPQHPFPRLILKYNLGESNHLNAKLEMAPWDIMDIFDEIDDASEYFKTLFLQLSKDFIPSKFITVRPRDDPWMTNEVRRYIRSQHRAYKTWRRNQTAHNHNHYIQSRLATDNSKKNAQNHYYDSLTLRLLDPKTGTKEYWRLTKELYGNKVKSGIPSLLIGDKVVSSPETKCKIFNEHFIKKAKLPDNLPPLPEFNIEIDYTLNSITVTQDDVYKILKNLDTLKVSGKTESVTQF